MGQVESNDEQIHRRSYPKLFNKSSLVSTNLEKLVQSDFNNWRKHQIRSVEQIENQTENFIEDNNFVLIDFGRIRNLRKVGEGHFGVVYRGIYDDSIEIALKTFHSNSDRSKRKKFSEENLVQLIDEARIMNKLKHQNLLKFHGITLIGDEKRLGLVTELMINGCLIDYLREQRKCLDKKDLKSIQKILDQFQKQIFNGMLYLESQSIVHRDLAARNCLIGENNQLKIADFGLTRFTDCGFYKGTYRSICSPRWASPEVLLQSKYSSRSDVWSFGVTCWELYSLGERPYGDIPNVIIRKILSNPSEDLTLFFPKPNYSTSDYLYTHIILRCLTYNLTVRPRFKDLIERISNIVE